MRSFWKSFRKCIAVCLAWILICSSSSFFLLSSSIFFKASSRFFLISSARFSMASCFCLCMSSATFFLFSSIRFLCSSIVFFLSSSCFCMSSAFFFWASRILSARSTFDAPSSIAFAASVSRDGPRGPAPTISRAMTSVSSCCTASKFSGVAAFTLLMAFLMLKALLALNWSSCFFFRASCRFSSSSIRLASSLRFTSAGSNEGGGVRTVEPPMHMPPAGAFHRGVIVKELSTGPW
mmetsp:Transcript_93726/g.262193  ORF Transcript_93726/g.262193 Transcript_93726/m.262193 type:complete len:236 (-) Transcript_93726:41-748(-)